MVEVEETTGVVSLELEVPLCIPMQCHLSVKLLVSSCKLSVCLDGNACIHVRECTHVYMSRELVHVYTDVYTDACIHAPYTRMRGYTCREFEHACKVAHTHTHEHTLQTSARTRTRMQICVRTHAHNHARIHTGCLQQLPLIDRYIEDGD